MLRYVPCLIALFVLTPALHAQGTVKTAAPTAAMASDTASDQWEYLVVSFGKTYFSDPSDSKDSGASKTVSMSSVGVIVTQEALATQRNMDKLGRFGWELVGIVGSIGGDQQMMFKRPYDPKRAAREATVIAREAQLLAAASKAAGEKDASAAVVDLDSIERLQRRSKIDQDKTTLYQDKAKEAVGKDNVISNCSVAVVYDGDDKDTIDTIRVTVEVDVTKTMISEGNQYRRSQVRTLAKGIADKMVPSGSVGSDSTMISVGVQAFATIGGKRFDLGSGYAFGWAPKS